MMKVMRLSAPATSGGSVRSSCTGAFALEEMEARTLLSASAFPAAAPHAPPVDSRVYAPHSEVHGKTMGQWTADWWKWATSFSVPNDPFTDATGANANLKQKGSVFFLAANAAAPTERSFTVPGNKSLLIPLVSAELSQVEVGFDQTPAQVRQAAHDQALLIDNLHLSIDGVPVQNLFSFEEVSPYFHFVAAPDNIIGVPAGNSGVAVADGYFVMLKPLGPGQHVINFGGGISQYDFFINDTDHIAITPGHGGNDPGHGGSGHDDDDDRDGPWDD